MIVFACTELMHSFLGVTKVYCLWISVIDLFEIYHFEMYISKKRARNITLCDIALCSFLAEPLVMTTENKQATTAITLCKDK